MAEEKKGEGKDKKYQHGKKEEATPEVKGKVNFVQAVPAVVEEIVGNAGTRGGVLPFLFWLTSLKILFLVAACLLPIPVTLSGVRITRARQRPRLSRPL